LAFPRLEREGSDFLQFVFIAIICVYILDDTQTPSLHGQRTASEKKATAGFEPAIRVLQTRALPLGYVATGNLFRISL
jgi:hypothetical protein